MQINIDSHVLTYHFTNSHSLVNPEIFAFAL
jgi:hypothetical protein